MLTLLVKVIVFVSCFALLSKGISACKQLLTSFSGIVFHALSRGAIFFVPSVSFLLETLQQPIRNIHFEGF